MKVGLDDVGDAHRFLRRRFEVRLDLQLWIHHSACSGAASAEDVAGTPGLGGEDLAEDHGSLLLSPCVTPDAGRRSISFWHDITACITDTRTRISMLCSLWLIMFLELAFGPTKVILNISSNGDYESTQTEISSPLRPRWTPKTGYRWTAETRP